MQISRLSLLFLIFFLSTTSAQFDCNLPPAACADCFTWCPSQSAHCETTAIILDVCRKTCGTCISNNTECQVLNCDQQCIPRDDSNFARCACFPGFELDADGRSCNDINECEQNSRRCDNVEGRTVCLNTPGTAVCTACQTTNPTKVWSYYNRTDCCLRNPSQQCGKSSTNGGRITGGEDAPAQAWPWMTYVQIGSNLCGGTLISDRHVLSAAHCLSRVVNNPNAVTLVLGTSELGLDTSVHAQTFKPIKITIHPQYVFPDNDLAILELDSPVRQSTFAAPACLPNNEVPSDDLVCFAIGYGTQSEGGVATRTLQQVDLPIVPISVCEEAYENRTNDVVPGIHICAGYVEGGKDTCQGDSGGPLMCQRCANCDWYVAGVTSFGRGCARPGFYGVYTNVTRFENWINSVTGMPDQPPQGECVKAAWTSWGSWTNCAATCGVGERTRARGCSNGEVGDPGCMGEIFEIGTCNGPACSGPSWSSWTPGTCSRTCGAGVRQSTRSCISGNIGDTGCPFGGDTRTEDCYIVDCPTWNNWEEWSSCSVTCGNGVRRAVRECNTFGVEGATCEGSSSRTEPCVQSCWGSWSPFEDCTTSCGGGVQYSTRMCQFGTEGDLGCPGENERQRECNIQMCPSWDEWSFVGACSVTCGGGERTQRRQCNNGNVGDPGCEGPNQRSVGCNNQACPAEWGEWEEFGACSAACGPGTQTRTRECEGGSVGTGNCRPASDASETRNCQIQACSIVQWEEWTPIGSCSATCGGGQRRETRQCSGGFPGDPGCFGSSERFVPCNEQSCPAEWSEWNEFGSCNVSCGGGVRTRSRECIGGAVGTGNCIGDTTDSEPCNTDECSGSSGGVCGGLVNVQTTENCCSWVQLQYCLNFARFMQDNCQLACCRERERLPCNGESTGTRTCQDQPNCSSFTNFCAFFPSVRESCPVTCNTCPQQ